MSLTAMGRGIESLGTMTEKEFDNFKSSILANPDNSANFLELFRQLCGQAHSIKSRDRMMEIHAECAPPDTEEPETPQDQTIVVNGRKILFPE
jgi:hypothetical protein